MMILDGTYINNEFRRRRVIADADMAI